MRWTVWSVVWAAGAGLGAAAAGLPETGTMGLLKMKVEVMDYVAGPLALVAYLAVVGLASVTVLVWCCVDEATEPSVLPASYPRFGRNRRAVRERQERLSAAVEGAGDSPLPALPEPEPLTDRTPDTAPPVPEEAPTEPTQPPADRDYAPMPAFTPDQAKDPDQSKDAEKPKDGDQSKDADKPKDTSTDQSGPAQ